MMATPEQQRHSMIERAVRRLPDPHADGSILLWQSLAAELCVIIGERGVESLDARSLYRAGAAYPWLEPHPPQDVAVAFRPLALRLQGCTPIFSLT